MFSLVTRFRVTLPDIIHISLLETTRILTLGHKRDRNSERKVQMLDVALER